ncbi:B12-binding domain-containing radical SAM protein [Varunaivibrio sulfuroxidans]|uniref:Radical SAM superfamily enzyme YgiQ (UPF0313 family) n=1 Tax=Varunaivibrio sulfuroxidans TaxID=1773489 RepID=A0A4V2UP65_9PROT|nr:radical SAM protein [Varunaivibrio sulfuroxidans]TCS64731.1 radical SAM superfamily enzyme YgiQ (UPF0313 family) [Varunaivibrio sulfuroxidans]WES29964.1 radical SAM protein [Varunaivibrio sulfuroxidans]
MHVLLVVPRYNDHWGEFYQIPLGLGYIASAMKNAGHRVTSLNLNHCRGSVKSLIKAKIAETNPDACASGSLAPFLFALKDIFAAARGAKPEIINIAGGGLVSGEPEMSLNVLDIDVGVISEGEGTIVELLTYLEKSGDLHDVNGIVFRDANGKIVQTLPRTQIRELGDLAWPDYDLLECDKNIANQRPHDSYFFHTQPDSEPRCVDMISSRSCPFSCTFCFHPVGKVYRERPLDEFFAELDVVVERYQINMVALIDELFSLKRKRLLEFCERIKPYNLKWMVQLHVSSVDEETLSAMSEAGCTYVSYGIESMSLPVLQSMKKKTKPERIDAALALTYKYKIGIQGNLLFGDKAETLETANESMHWWAHNRRYTVNLTPLVVFPGSPDYYQALKDGMIEDREAYVRDIPTQFNISLMNDDNIEMVRFQIWVFANTLLNLAPLTSFKVSQDQIPDRDPAYDIEWDCPRCDHHNNYRGTILPYGEGRTLRLTCRECLTRWDIENKTHLNAEGVNEDIVRPSRRRLAEGLRLAGALKRKIREGKFRDIANKASAIALNAMPSRKSASPSQDTRPSKHVIKSVGGALQASPFDPQKHCNFAEALIGIGAYGAARMHYQQALLLSPDNSRAKAGLAVIDGPSVTDAQRRTYFVSWSDAPPPVRKENPEAVSCSS